MSRIDVRGLRVDYIDAQSRTTRALAGVDLSINAGEFVVALGASGCGKTTLLNCLAGFVAPTSGQILLDGHEIDGPGADRGVVFQRYGLMPWLNVRDNVALGLKLRGVDRKTRHARALELLRWVGLEAHAASPVYALSGGMQQRVGIARALASQPDVLLSDEATSALDPETTRSILDLLRKINRELGLTIVLITHQMEVIKQVCDRVAVLDAGRVVELGRVIDVFLKPEHDVTRALIGEVISQELPPSVLARVESRLTAREQGGRDHLFRLAFTGAGVDQPVLAQAIRNYGLDFNILHGHIDEIQGQAFGSLAILASGETADINNAMNFLREQGVVVEEINHVV